MMTIRMSPPASSKFGPNPCTVNQGPNKADQPGRTYSCAVGSTIDVTSNEDALQLIINGWHSHGSVVATSSRPVSANKGTYLIDSTLGAVILFDGTQWRNVLTGAVV